MSFLNAVHLNPEDKKKFHFGIWRKSLADTATPLAGLRCLVLDDELLIALDIQQILEAAGAAVLCAGNAPEALTSLQAGERFDLAVLDVMLNGTIGNSLAVATALLERRIPFVFLTGMRTEDIQHTGRFPSAPVVEKPYQASLLLEAIAQALAANP